MGEQTHPDEHTHVHPHTVVFAHTFTFEINAFMHVDLMLLLAMQKILTHLLTVLVTLC